MTQDGATIGVSTDLELNQIKSANGIFLGKEWLGGGGGGVTQRANYTLVTNMLFINTHR